MARARALRVPGREVLLSSLLAQLVLAGCAGPSRLVRPPGSPELSRLAAASAPRTVADDEAAASEEGAGGAEKETEPDGDEQDEAEDLADPGFLRRYFPLTLNDELAAAVDEIAVTTYLINIVPFGALWGPLVFLDDDGRPDVGQDIILSWLIPGLSSVGAVVLLGGAGGVLLAFSGVLSGLTGCPLCVCGALPCFLAGLGLGIPLSLFGFYYVTPTATLNAWDRAYRFPQASDDKKKKSKKKKSKKKPQQGESSQEADPEAAPSADGDASGAAERDPAELYGY